MIVSWLKMIVSNVRQAAFRCRIPSVLTKNKRCIQGPCGRRYLVLPVSHFQHIIDDIAPTCVPYAGDPLALTSPSRRGKLLEALVRDVLVQAGGAAYGHSAISNKCCVNGRRRGLHQAEWDWTLSGRKIEVKSSQLGFDKCNKTWRVYFAGVKLARDGYRDLQPFDDLYLAIYAPSGFSILLHDQETGVTPAGALTKAKGHDIVVRGSCGETWTGALATILQKMMHRGCCKLVAQVSTADPLAQALYTRLRQESIAALEEAYREVPMSLMNPTVRGRRVQRIGMAIDQMQNPTAVFAKPRDGKTHNGFKRGETNASVDWKRDDMKVELKHAKVTFCSRAEWQIRFSNVKADAAVFDELWLAVYSPCGLYFLKHPPCYTSFGSRGVLTKITGRQLKVCAGRGLDVQDAVDEIMMKLQARGCELLATVVWNW